MKRETISLKRVEWRFSVKENVILIYGIQKLKKKKTISFDVHFRLRIFNTLKTVCNDLNFIECHLVTSLKLTLHYGIL